MNINCIKIANSINYDVTVQVIELMICTENYLRRNSQTFFDQYIVTVCKTWLAHFLNVCWGWSSEKSVHIIVILMKGSENDKRMDRRVPVEKPKDSAWEYSLSRYNIVRRIPYPFELPSFLRDRLINSWGHEMSAADFGSFQSVKFKLDRCNVLPKENKLNNHSSHFFLLLNWVMVVIKISFIFSFLNI